MATSKERAFEINQTISQWWKNRDHNQLSVEEIKTMINDISSPPAIWYQIPEKKPYNSMENWCEKELGCDADFFLNTLQSIVGEDAISHLRDRRLSGIFRPIDD